MVEKNRRNFIIDLSQLVVWVGMMLIPALVDLTITGKLVSAMKILGGTLHFLLPLFLLYALNYYYLVPHFLHKQGKARWFYLTNAVILIGWSLYRITRHVEFPQAR